MNPATLHVVGLGPGDVQCLTPQARQVLHEARCVAGYHLYMDLVPPELLEGKTRISTGMRQEAERCAAAVDAALAGEPTALVCSGDPGIYALAGLALETLEARGLVGVVPFAVVPGVPAVCAAAALLGAPLMHDFAVISLSDCMTPLEQIYRRVALAAEADFVICLYNPKSRSRTAYLAEAAKLIQQHRKPETPVGIVRNAGREGKRAWITTLEKLPEEPVDMFCVVLVGNSQTYVQNGKMITPRGYCVRREESC